jgi:ERCC4-related helicase
MLEPGAFDRGAPVRHKTHGNGTVESDIGDTVVVRFDNGIEICAREDLELLLSIEKAIAKDTWDSPYSVINRAQAEAIISINQVWGMFARSRIQLLPHQLWVCRRVNQEWPARWLVADDVGLGKTIEAGIILSSLLASGQVRRLLVLCPASLVDQWQLRLREMFDIRLSKYIAAADTATADFWDTHHQVVASFHTLRLDVPERQERMLNCEPWDMLIVDEAHHMNADEDQGFTLGYQLIRRLEQQGQVNSMLFFTGTPHRGKNFGFLALLHLLRPDLFDPRKSLDEQLVSLRQVMVRNNKYSVTDLEGNRLFEEPEVVSETYSYSDAERHFYNMLSDFIVRGKAYASSLSQQQNNAVMLVLISMQKLASSSVAAIRRALTRRLQGIRTGREKLEKLQSQVNQAKELEESYAGDELAALEEEVAELMSSLPLMEDEENALIELIGAADRVSNETKIERILEVLGERFNGLTVLFFTEYKATQSLLMSALMRNFGDDCVTFINGEDRADDVIFPDGHVDSVIMQRKAATDSFNSGKIRFLISTEAGGEGIDLQENCYTLVHVDLPWNPMRLHQRVGRLLRYGQSHRVSVLNMRNPDTVESRIWDRLFEKLELINQAFAQAMDDPEDLMSLVLGMSSPSLFRGLFANAPGHKDRLDEWFDTETATFGGVNTVEAVKAMVGNVSRFDFGRVSDQLPQVDLPDLESFLDISLALHGRRLSREEEGLSFITPHEWKTDPAIRNRYTDMVLDRHDPKARDTRHLLGVGHKAIDIALDHARARTVSVTTVPVGQLEKPILIFRVFDKVTDRREHGTVICGISIQSVLDDAELLFDWQLLLRLNAIQVSRQRGTDNVEPPTSQAEISTLVEHAKRQIPSFIGQLDIDYRIPDWQLIAVVWPC